MCNGWWRSLLGGTLALVLCGPAMAEVPSLVFLGFELVDEQPDPTRDAEHQRRQALIGQQMSQGFAERGLYRVVAAERAHAAVDEARAQSEFLYRCNGCLGPVGQAAGAQLVGVGWVQRVSNLILNINIEIRDVQGDRMVLTKSVDIRGDNDESWRRGVAYMLRDMVERRQRQPAYGM